MYQIYSTSKYLLFR